MEDENYGDGAPEEFQPDSDDLKKKAVAQSSQAAEQLPDGQNRGVLHYGQPHEGDPTGAVLPQSDPRDLDQTALPDNKTESDFSAEQEVGSTYDFGLERREVDQDATRVEAETSSKDIASDTGSSTTQDAGQVTAETESAAADATTPLNVSQDTVEMIENDEVDAERPVDEVPDSEEQTTENRAPTELTMSNLAVAENVEGVVVGTLSVSDPDAGDSHTFSLSDDRFEVVDGQVKLKAGMSLDHEDAAGVSLDVMVTDSGGATFTESFDIAVEDVNEEPTELTMSNLAVAENVEGAVVGTLSVSDQDIGDLHTFSLSDDRFEVVDGRVKLKPDASLDHQDAASVSLDVTVTDSGGATFTESFDIAVADMPDIALDTGFHAKYFDMDQHLDEIDDIDWNSEATHEELVGDINYTNSSNSFWDGGSRDTFGVQITGNIEVEEGGVFNFHIGGDDGVVLYVDGKEVVDNDGLHGYRTRSGEVELEPGAHVIEVRYFENYGHAGLKVEWEGPGIDGRELLAPPDVGELQTVSGMPVTLDLDIDMSQSGAGDISHVIEGLPSGTVVQAGDMIIEVGEAGTAEITGWDTSMLTITPPVDFVGKVDAQLTTNLTLETGDTAVSATGLAFGVDEADLSVPPLELEAGFRASYFDVDHTLRTLDDVNWEADPTKEEVVGEIDYENGRESFWEGGSSDTFGVRITGEITVDEAGSFDFFIGGDDGVVLYVDGIEVIDNDGLHGYRTRSGEIDLEPGTHEIEVRYFENYGHAGLKLEWEGPGTDGRELVRADTDLSVAENGTLEIRLSNADVSEDGSVTISGLPPETILISGDQSAVSDGSDIDLSGWDLDIIELSPPVDFEGVISAEISMTDRAFNGATIESSETFEIEVGDVENASEPDDAHDHMLLADSENPDADGQSWVDDSDTAQGDDDASEDDVMDEPVAESHGNEQSSEMVETYERSDW
ncbi:PA14 domain-containing protein [Roseovarius aestuarii]|uniref:PA14 domain protein n=1 Tax=Roseovarius aestuarii TaxID=475083 RepID=A0A1X7BM41_9RHOB|nr:PA14 domain-containing protein [Roseovarius aestuarii]SMC10686.1 PA14 domain protein [Roseovarius aestuarii]